MRRAESTNEVVERAELDIYVMTMMQALCIEQFLEDEEQEDERREQEKANIMQQQQQSDRFPQGEIEYESYQEEDPEFDHSYQNYYSVTTQSVE